MSMLEFRRAAALVCIAVAAAVPCSAGAAPQASPALDAATRSQVIAAVAQAMSRSYVFPQLGKQVRAALLDPARTQALAGTADPVQFAEQLTGVLQAITHDKHLRVAYSVKPQPEQPEQPDNAEPTQAETADERLREQQLNFGIERVERLPGNIGVIEVREFVAPERAGSTIAAALALVAHTDALIVDLRRNPGGDPATVALMSSYLFDQRTHLSDFYEREGERHEQSWTQDWVPGPRFGGKKPVYVLTSALSASGAEEFSYNLRNLRRATLVGKNMRKCGCRRCQSPRLAAPAVVSPTRVARRRLRRL
jgi:retinol-binding protein 3